MSLFGTIQQSAGALQVHQMGLQVVGQNIANSNTPGYIRQELRLASGEGVREGHLIKGLGVRPIGIVQVIDQALTERMFHAQTALSGSEVLQRAYSQLEELATDFTGEGLTHQLSEFTGALHDLSTQPTDPSLRQLVIAQGTTLAGQIRTHHQAALDRSEFWNHELSRMSDDINRLTQNIARLNLEIANIEGGGLVASDATGLRDQRYRDLEELATYVDINYQEQESGAVAVFVGGDYLVNNGTAREVYTSRADTQRGPEIRIVETDSPLQAAGGKLAATLVARDEIIAGYLQGLDEFSSALIRAVNEVHSQGQGKRGHTLIVSDQSLAVDVPLQDAGLPWTPRNGSFDINVVDTDGRIIGRHRIGVRMLGGTGDSTMESIVAQIDAIDGIVASVTADGHVEIRSDSAASAFTFGEDTSGLLAAVGINTFFSGSSAVDIAVAQPLQQDPELLAVSAAGIAEDTQVLNELTEALDKPLDFLGGRSVRSGYERVLTDIAQQGSRQRAALDGHRDLHATLQSQHLAITGVNIDEEAIQMAMYQRAFQASSRVIATAIEMLELLVTL